MLLDGSCHCGAVKFRVESPETYPFLRCYCSICRKTAGRVCDQPRRALRHARGREVRLRLPGAHRRGTEPRPKAFLRKVQQCPLGLRPALAGAGSPLRLGDRYPAPEAAGARPHHAQLRRAVVRDPLRSERETLPRVPRRVAGGLAPPPRPARRTAKRLSQGAHLQATLDEYVRTFIERTEERKEAYFRWISYG
jgi:hypothetical protein